MICIRINLFVAYVTADRWLQNENTYSMMYHMSCTKFFWTIRRHECIIYCTLMQNCYIERFNKQINKNRLWMKYTHSIFLNSNNSDLFICSYLPKIYCLQINIQLLFMFDADCKITCIHIISDICTYITEYDMQLIRAWIKLKYHIFDNIEYDKHIYIQYSM